jgi:hypothetical protein
MVRHAAPQFVLKEEAKKTPNESPINMRRQRLMALNPNRAVRMS